MAPDVGIVHGELLLALTPPDVPAADAEFERAAELAGDRGARMAQLQALTHLAVLRRGAPSEADAVPALQERLRRLHGGVRLAAPRRGPRRLGAVAPSLVTFGGCSTFRRASDRGASMYNLRNRSFLKEVDFEPDELRHLLKLSEALKTAKYAGNEVQRLEGKEIALIFEKTSTRTRSAFEVACLRPGCARHLPRPVRLPARATRSRSPTPLACSAGCTTPSSSGARPRTTSRSWPGSPACPSTTASPTSGTRPRCSPTSSRCTRRAASPTTR